MEFNWLTLNGKAAIALPVKPPDLRDTRMVDRMQGNYWFWRVREGGQVEPFRSQGSTMLAWKTVLSVEDRWAVIAYQHVFSGHHGPHVTSEHPQMALPDGGGGRGHATSPTSVQPGQVHHLAHPIPGSWLIAERQTRVSEIARVLSRMRARIHSRALDRKRIGRSAGFRLFGRNPSTPWRMR
jgi:hypothetical protein